MRQLKLPTSRELDAAFADLQRDLLAEGGPHINTMRNHAFAMMIYAAKYEYWVRRRAATLVETLQDRGWRVLQLSLQQLFLARLEAVEPGYLDQLIETETLLADPEPARAIEYLSDALRPELDALADDCAAAIAAFTRAAPPDPDHPDGPPTLCVIGRAGSLYPYFRFSSLLKNMAGKTHGVPVLLLYPGERRGETGLSFLGQLEPDRDYRPRMYG